MVLRTIIIKQSFQATFIQLQDKRGKLLASLYFSGSAYVPCFTSLQNQWFKNKVCVSFFLNNTPTCVFRNNSSISGQFLGEEANSTYSLNPELRKTFFYMNYYQKTDMSWFGRYNMICMDENNGSGQFQGDNLQNFFEAHLRFWKIYSTLGNEFVNKRSIHNVVRAGVRDRIWESHGFKTFTWVIVILVGILLATGASVYIGLLHLKIE
ncbi:Conserved_hypothetical protein [Hexamita inflata]|uniref:Uncharacterized protein n=1 Tax=Hexamita inflata TaxID=28002 RepID=A0AA86QFY4_9EUKA|nr:Conserved hypothetical protein [Hexamita inflata]